MGAGDTSMSPTCSAYGHMEKQLRLKVLNRPHQLLVTSFPSCGAWAGNLTSLGPTFYETELIKPLLGSQMTD